MTARKKRIRHPGAAVSAKQYDHGTHACYVLNKCRCDPCRAANLAYEKRRRRWAREFPYEPPPLVDPRPARRHVKALMAKGMGTKRIAHLAGVPESCVGALIWGRYDRAAKRIRRQTSEKLLAVEYQAAGSMKVPAGEAHALIDELLARGWWKAAIGQRVVGPHAKSLQVAKSATGMVEANTILILRTLLDEEVPKRQHPRGHFYQPEGREPRPVPQSTPGMYTEEGQASLLESAAAQVAARREEQLGRAKLRCKVCDRPLAFHLITERCA